MGAPAKFFRRHGFRLTFSRPTEDELRALYTSASAVSVEEYRRLRGEGAIGPVVATLTSIENPDAVLVAYGTGADEDTAAVRAHRRWLAEQGD